jgi:hypothetical protein
VRFVWRCVINWGKLISMVLLWGIVWVLVMIAALVLVDELLIH